MAISGYIGLPGCGKSFTVVKSAILPALKQGRNVWTNIPLNNDELEKDGYPLANHFEIDDIINNDNWFDEILPKGALLIIDEVQLLWASGLKQTQANPKHVEFLTKHRHLVGEDGKSTEIILLTQRYSLIANFVRGLIEKTFVINNLAIIGKPKNYRIDIYPQIVPDRPNPKNKIKDIFGKYDPAIYKYYKSHTASDGEAGDETRIDDRISALSGWQVKLYFSVFAILVFGLIYMGYSFFTESKLVNNEKKTSKPIKQKIQKKDNSQNNQTSFRQSSKKSQKPKQPENHLLNQISDGYISFNMGKFPFIDYEIKVNFENQYTKLTSKELVRLGYRLNPINNCLLEVKKNDFIKYFGCRSEPYIQPQSEDNFFSNAVVKKD